jgi:regulator of protease activity HflC (stomatin/prohibitin superfamily)
MDIDAQIEKVRSEAARKVRRLKEKKKKDAQRLEDEGRKKICDFVVGESKNLQMQFTEELEKGEVLKLWSWLKKRADAEITKLQKAPREAQAPEAASPTSEVPTREAENA